MNRRRFLEWLAGVPALGLVVGKAIAVLGDGKAEAAELPDVAPTSPPDWSRYGADQWTTMEVRPAYSQGICVETAHEDIVVHGVKLEPGERAVFQYDGERWNRVG